MRPWSTLLDAYAVRDVDLSPAPELAEVLIRMGDLEGGRPRWRPGIVRDAGAQGPAVVAGPGLAHDEGCWQADDEVDATSGRR